MERIDVLKGVEQFLVQKAYETGHISHRADGDWQKQADGSWIPYKGQSSQSAPQTQEPTENTEYGEITEEDLKGSNTTDTSNIDTKEKKRDVQNKIHGVFNLYDEDTKKMLGMRRDEHGYDGEIRFYADGSNIKPASDRKEFDKVVRYYLDKAGLEDTPFNHKVAHKYIVGYAKNNGLIGDYYWSKVLYPNGYDSDDSNEEDSNASTVDLHGDDEVGDSNDWEEEDTEGYYGNSGGLRSTIYEGAYDTQISNIGNTEEDDYGNSIPNDEAVENVVRGIMQEWTGDTDDEDAVEAVHDGLKDAVLDRWSSIYVQKSAVRDMRSTPTVKNMGF